MAGVGKWCQKFRCVATVMNKIVEILFGSNLYGTITENSDLDFKAIYLPTSREIVLSEYKKSIYTVRPKQAFERNTKDDVDLEILSLDRFLHLLLEGQTMALDMLFALPTNWTYVGRHIGYFNVIYNNRHKLLNKNINAFVGYAKQQAAKYGLKGFRIAALRQTLEWLKELPEEYILEECYPWNFISGANNEHITKLDHRGPNRVVLPHLHVCGKSYPYHATVKYVKAQIQRKFDEYGSRALMAEKNEGVDWKALSHAVRVNSEAAELLTTGNITFPRPDAPHLLDIKLGKLNYKDIANEIEEGLVQLETLKNTSVLRDTPDFEWAENFIYEVYKDIVKNG